VPITKARYRPKRDLHKATQFDIRASVALRKRPRKFKEANGSSSVGAASREGWSIVAFDGRFGLIADGQSVLYDLETLIYALKKTNCVIGKTSGCIEWAGAKFMRTQIVIASYRSSFGREG
jgi:hypothetical protein